MPLPGTTRRRIMRATNIRYLLQDRFPSDVTALGSIRQAEPGPGSWSVIDTNGVMSVVGGKLLINGTPAANDLLVSQLITRQAGRVLLWEMPDHTLISASPRPGWGDATTGVTYGFAFASASSVNARLASGGTAETTTIGSGSIGFCIILRNTGAYILLRPDTYAAWKLLWVDNQNNSSLYAKILLQAAQAANCSFDDARVADLGGVYASSDYGLATQMLTNPAGGTNFTHPVDMHLDYIVTTLPSAGASNKLQMNFRQQDANNYWQVVVNSSGTFNLNEIIAGSNSTRSTAAGVVSAGHRVVVVTDGTTIRGYSGPANGTMTLRWTWTSATNFVTATDGQIASLGTGGAISEFATYPLYPQIALAGI